MLIHITYKIIVTGNKIVKLHLTGNINIIRYKKCFNTNIFSYVYSIKHVLFRSRILLIMNKIYA